MFDLILKGGEIFDGVATTSFVGDVAIKDDKIAAIAPPVNLS